MGSILDFSYDPFPFRGGWIGGLALVVLAAILWAFRRRSGLDRADPRRIGAFGLFAAGGLLVAAHIPLLSARRARERTLEERFRLAGIPVELLNRPGREGFADGE